MFQHKKFHLLFLLVNVNVLGLLLISILFEKYLLYLSMLSKFLISNALMNFPIVAAYFAYTCITAKKVLTYIIYGSKEKYCPLLKLR